MKKNTPGKISSTESLDETDVPVSRTRLKKEDHARQKLGERLAGLSVEQLERLNLSTELHEAVLLAIKTTAHGARRRQMKHIGSLLRQVDTEPILNALDDYARGDHNKKLAFKRIETWRDQLRAGNMMVVEDILEECPPAERQHLAQLARNAKNEFDENKGTKASKALFKYLKDVSGQ